MVATKGTKEWADTNVNCVAGCSHDCKYCYAKRMAIRFKRATAETWKDMIVRPGDVEKTYRKRAGRIMFPTSHDITPAVMEPCFKVLGKLLAAGNEVLVTTKPHFAVIAALTKQFEDYRDQVQFRFTITSKDDAMLAAWEPGAPGFKERRAALHLAFTRRWKTSISIEPCLDKDPRPLIEAIRPFVSESIWLGVMNYQKDYHVTSHDVAKWVLAYKNDPLVRFKDSIDTGSAEVRRLAGLVEGAIERFMKIPIIDEWNDE